MPNGLIRRFREFLPAFKEEHIISLDEGGTPLLETPRLAKAIGMKQGKLYLKLEGMNPTGSFKDRGMTVAVSHAFQEGAKAIITASTGNTSASAAAYAARAGLKCVVLVPHGKIARGKLSQALIHGAHVLSINGNFDQALELVIEISRTQPIVMVNSLNPMRLEGQKTGSFEIIEALGRAPDYQFMPVGNAGNITGYWMGFQEFFENGKAKSRPKMMGFQAEGAAPIVRGEKVDDPHTIATAIRIGNPASWKKALAARDESEGVIDMVSDEEILSAYRDMASLEGVFCEPASAAGVAGLRKYLSSGKLSPSSDTIITAIVTGHGLKDPDTAIGAKGEMIPVSAEKNDIMEQIKI